MYQSSQVFLAQVIVEKFSFCSEHITLKMFPSARRGGHADCHRGRARASRLWQSLFFYSLCTLDRKASRYTFECNATVAATRSREDAN